MSTFVSGVAGAAVKAAVTSIVVGVVVVSVMHYIGVPVPSAHELLRGFSRLVRLS
jgi:hypothetical protein